MIFIGIDVAKDKHDCFIVNSKSNSLDGFNDLFCKIKSVSSDLSKTKVGLEATGHYSYNLLGFLLDKGLTTYVLNPLHTNLYRKSLSLRKTKTDKVDARTIASMLMSCVDLKPYTRALYHNQELKSLTRYRFDKVSERAKLKTSVSRLVTILFPELEILVSTLHTASVYALLSEFPSAKHIANANLTRLTNLLYTASKGHYNRETAISFREAARQSIGSVMPSKSLELKHTIKLIGELNAEIDEIEVEIKHIVDSLGTTILTVPGIGYATAESILAEIGDFSNFETPDKILAFAGMSPSTYQSGQLTNCHAHMEKRGSKYLRFSLYNATKYVCKWDKNFSAYLNPHTLSYPPLRDWDKYGDSEEDFLKCKIDRVKKFYEAGTISFEQFIDDTNEYSMDLYKAQEGYVDDLLKKQSDYISDLREQFSEQEQALRDSWDVEDRAVDMADVQNQLDIYKGAVTDRGQQKYKELQEQMKQLQRDEELYNLQVANNATIESLEAEYKQMEEGKANILEGLRTANINISAYVDSISDSLSQTGVRVESLLSTLIDKFDSFKVESNSMTDNRQIINNISQMTPEQLQEFVNSIVGY